MNSQDNSVDSLNDFLNEQDVFLTDPLKFDWSFEVDSSFCLGQSWDVVPEQAPIGSGWSWDPSDFGITTKTFSSTGSSDESSKTVLLPAAEFLFNGGESTETLADRLSQRVPALPSVTITTGQQSEESQRSFEAALKSYLDHTKKQKLEAAPMVSKTAKRKLPEVDLESIVDPEERKKQRRMAKNRRTAAVSRLRQKARLENLETEIQNLQDENQKLKSLLSYFIPMKNLEEKTEEDGPHFDELATLLTDIYLATLQSNMVQLFVWSLLNKILILPVIFSLSFTSPLIVSLTVKKMLQYSHSVAGLWLQSGVG